MIRVPQADDTIIQVRISGANLEALKEGVRAEGVRLRLDDGGTSSAPIYSIWLDARADDVIPNPAI